MIIGAMIIQDKSFLSRSNTSDGHQYTAGADTARLAGCSGLPIAFRSVEVMRAGSPPPLRGRADLEL